ALSVVSGLALAGAMLTKSPVLALALHLGAIGGFYAIDLALETPWRELRESPWRVCLRRYLAPPASIPPIVACLVFGLWLVPFKHSISQAEWDLVVHQFKYE